MTIQILTRHPALMYVLTRTAPLGITVRSNPKVRRGHVPVYLIDVDTQMLGPPGEAKILAAWLPSYVHYYGVQRFAIDGRPVPFDNEHLLRQVFLGRDGLPEKQASRPVGEQILRSPAA